jgi:hypothetical protein
MPQSSTVDSDARASDIAGTGPAAPMFAELARELMAATRECRRKEQQIEAHRHALEHASRAVLVLRRANRALTEENATLRRHLENSNPAGRHTQLTGAVGASLQDKPGEVERAAAS